MQTLVAALILAAAPHAATTTPPVVFHVAGADCPGFVADSLPGVRRAGAIYVDGVLVVTREPVRGVRIDHDALRSQCQYDASVVEVRIERA